jgi:hypothetical protein
MKDYVTSHPNYLAQHHEQAAREALDSIVRGCKAVLHARGGFRGGLGNLSMELAQHVSLPLVLTVSVLRKEAGNLRAQGIDITLHDTDGFDVEMKPIGAPVSET